MAYNYIISSDDKDAANDKIEEIKKSLPFEFDYSMYDLDEEGMYSVIDEMTTVSLFSSPKFIVVKSCEEIINISDKALNELLRTMNDTTTDNVLVLLFLKGFDFQNEKLGKIKKYASMIQIQLKNIPLDQYAIKSFQEDGYGIDSTAITLLISFIGDLSSLKNAIEQLKCYKEEEKYIKDEDIKTLISAPLEDNVYQLVEAVLNQDKKRIFSCLQDLKLRSVQASYIVSLLINKFQELYNVSILIKSNISQIDLANLLHVSSGRAYYMIKNAKENRMESICKNLDLLNELEFKLKSGGIDQNLGLDFYLLQ